MYETTFILYMRCMMIEQLVDIINKNEDLIDDENWLELYSKCPANLRGMLTQVFNDADIHPEFDLTVLLPYFCYNRNDISSYTIGNQCIELSACAFYYADNLKKIILPNNLKRIGKSCFGNCSLERVVLPLSVQSIGDEAFAWNEHLTEVVLDTNIVSLGKSIFYGSTKVVVTYKGTQEQFSKILKSPDWDEVNTFSRKTVEVHCVDGIYKERK